MLVHVEVCDIRVCFVNDKPVLPIFGCITGLLNCAGSLVYIEVCVCVCVSQRY